MYKEKIEREAFKEMVKEQTVRGILETMVMMTITDTDRIEGFTPYGTKLEVDRQTEGEHKGEFRITLTPPAESPLKPVVGYEPQEIEFGVCMIETWNYDHEEVFDQDKLRAEAESRMGSHV